MRFTLAARALLTFAFVVLSAAGCGGGGDSVTAAVDNAGPAPLPVVNSPPLADFSGTWSRASAFDPGGTRNGTNVAVHASGFMSGGMSRSEIGHNEYTVFSGKFVLEGTTAVARAAGFTYTVSRLQNSSWITTNQYGTVDITLRKTFSPSGATALEISVANATVPSLAAKDTLTADRQGLPPPPIPFEHWTGYYKNGLIDPTGAVAWGKVSTCGATGVISDYDPSTSMFLFHGHVEGPLCEPFWRTGDFTFVGSASVMAVTPYVEALTMQVADGGAPFNVQLVRY